MNETYAACLSVALPCDKFCSAMLSSVPGTSLGWNERFFFSASFAKFQRAFEAFSA